MRHYPNQTLIVRIKQIRTNASWNCRATSRNAINALTINDVTVNDGHARRHDWGD